MGGRLHGVMAKELYSNFEVASSNTNERYYVRFPIPLDPFINAIIVSVLFFSKDGSGIK